MIDKEYKAFVDDTSCRLEYYTHTVKPYLINDYGNWLLWLQLLGLAETWDMIK